MSAVFGLAQYIASLEELQALHNDHFGYVSGDTLFWSDYSNSPIFPIDEQPESDNFYMLYNFAESHKKEVWWHVDTVFSLYVASNNVKLIADATRVIRKAVGDYHYATKRIMDWAVVNSIDMQPLNWIRFDDADMIIPQEQENGIKGRILTIRFNYTDC